MAKRVKFVLNRRAFREQVLMSPTTAALLRETLGGDAETDIAADGVRARARAYGRMSDEAKNGTLSRKLGGV